ncbi:MAG: TRAP transporter substrate-binding protein [Clostridiales Family XIII bacterium]|jgi:tripartite ATP-independent transporter DctP family solute receptor|nr:TRAP transporter substrate-binding protein [Clostridiales Family XIII bacterium]
MKKMRFNSVVLLVICTLVLSACGGSNDSGSAEDAAETPATTGETESPENFEKQTLQIGTTITPIDGKHIQWQTLEFLDEEINEATNGLIDLELYPSGQLGNEREVLEGLTMGTFKIADPYSVMGTISDIFNVYDMPYLFEDFDHFVNVCRSDLAKEMGKTLEAHNIKYLGMGSASGPYQISNNTREVKLPKDLNGLKIRAMDSPYILDSINALGAQAIPMAWTEVYTGLQQKTIDGVCTINTGYWSAKLYEVQKYVSELDMFYSPTWIVANLEWFNSLPVEIQEGIQKGVDAAMERHYVDCVEQDAALKEELVRLGMTYTNKDEIDIQAFKEAIQPVYEKYQSRYGDVIEQIRAMAN